MYNVHLFPGQKTPRQSRVILLSLYLIHSATVLSFWALPRRRRLAWGRAVNPRSHWIHLVAIVSERYQKKKKTVTRRDVVTCWRSRRQTWHSGKQKQKGKKNFTSCGVTGDNRLFLTTFQNPHIDVNVVVYIHLPFEGKCGKKLVLKLVFIHILDDSSYLSSIILKLEVLCVDTIFMHIYLFFKPPVSVKFHNVLIMTIKSPHSWISYWCKTVVLS